MFGILRYIFILSVLYCHCYYSNRSLGTFLHRLSIPFPNSGIEIIPLVNTAVNSILCRL